MKMAVIVATMTLNNGMMLPPQQHPQSFNTVQACLFERDKQRIAFDETVKNSDNFSDVKVDCTNPSGSKVYEWKDVPEEHRREGLAEELINGGETE